MTKNIRSYEKNRNRIKAIQKCEIENVKIAKKSIVAKKKILKGEFFGLII